MQFKRGQLTIFIIIGIVIVFGIIGFYFLQYSEKPETTDIHQNQKIIFLRDNTLECFEEVYISSLLFIGFQGGYFNVTDGIYNGFVEIPYYYKQGQLNIPSINMVENELETLIDILLYGCINYEEVISFEKIGINFSEKELISSDYKNYIINHDSYKTSVKINKDLITFKTNLDMTIEDKEKNRYIISFIDYPVSIESDLYSMHELAVFYATYLKENNELMCLDCLYDLTENNNLNIEMMNHLNEDDELVVISNEIESAPFVFQFLNKYSKGEEYEMVEFLPD